ncbi:MAG: IS3 family transposase [Faecalibacterium sp.]
METFFGRLKNEMFYGFEKDYPSFQAFSKAIAEYIDYYNNSRIQAKTKWMPPSIASQEISATFKQHICDMQFNVVAVALKS